MYLITETEMLLLLASNLWKYVKKTEAKTISGVFLERSWKLLSCENISKKFKLTYFGRVLGVWNHCALQPPIQSTNVTIDWSWKFWNVHISWCDLLCCCLWFLHPFSLRNFSHLRIESICCIHSIDTKYIQDWFSIQLPFILILTFKGLRTSPANLLFCQITMESFDICFSLSTICVAFFVLIIFESKKV